MDSSIVHGLLLACDRILSTSTTESETARMNLQETKICSSVSDAATMLRSGRLVAFPTETVYGLGADAQNVSAVARIFESKGRPTFDPLIVHVASRQQMVPLVAKRHQLVDRLADAFWPGPLTLVLPKTDLIPDLVTAGLPGVGLRMPANPLARELIEAAGCPVAAPSANPFGGISPTTAQHVLDGLAGRIDGVLDGGPCAVGVESTVISLMDDEPVLLRPGGLPVEDIESVVGAIQRARADPGSDDAAQPAPGMLSRHYAPGTPLVVIDRQMNPDAAADRIEPSGKTPGQVGLLTWGRSAAREKFGHVENLDPDGNLTVCAANFFAALRALDAAGLDAIIAHRFPDHGLGIALNDRLKRASTR